MRQFFDRLLNPRDPALPQGATSENLVLRRSEGRMRITRHSIGLDALVPDPYWARLFANESMQGVVALLVPPSRSGPGCLYWSTDTDIPQRLAGDKPSLPSSVTLQSTWNHDDVTGEPLTSVCILAEGNMASSAADAAKLALVLSLSGIEGNVSLVISSAHDGSRTGSEQTHFVGTFDEFRQGK